MSYNSKYTGQEVEELLDQIKNGGIGGGGSGSYAEVSHGTSDTTFTLTPNTFHVWDEVASLDLSFGSEVSGVANEYLFQFTSGATATTLTLPDDIKWANEPTIAENMIYQISVLKGLASVLEFSNKASIFPMYLTTEDSVYRNPDEQTIALADYILQNAKVDTAGTYWVTIPTNSVYIDGHEVSMFGSTNISNDKTIPYSWHFSDNYDYGYSFCWTEFEVSGENKGRMIRYDDD